MPSGDREAAREAPDDVAFMNALVTEHFVLQSMSSATTNESGTRASLFLLTLSSSLVSLGFAAQASLDAFLYFAGALLTTLVILGWLTMVRLVDISIANVTFLRRITQIRRYYARLTPDAPRYFPGTGDAAADSLEMLGARGRSSVLLLFTTASAVGVVTSAVLGSAAALLVANAWEAPLGVAIVIGVVVTAAHFGLVLIYERQRFRAGLPD